MSNRMRQVLSGLARHRSGQCGSSFWVELAGRAIDQVSERLSVAQGNRNKSAVCWNGMASPYGKSKHCGASMD